MLTREMMAEREARDLAPYAMRAADSRGRKHPEPEHPLRSAYQRDRERIIHSTAFRRLEYKTQVFVNHEGDHFRTRLTHTIEVAQIARAIARILNVNEDLVEAVALAHDLGHTPFGHSGEDALRECMKEHGGFEHNIHGLRVVDVLECRYPEFRGLNLTYEVRESIAKHTSAYDHPTTREFDPELQPLVEAQIVDAADGIAYISHDLDDAFAAGILTPSAYEEVELLGIVSAEVKKKYPNLDERGQRIQVVRFLINRLVTDICAATLARMQAGGIDSVERVRRAKGHVVAFSAPLQQHKDALQKHLFDRVYHHYRVARMTAKAKRFVQAIFGAYIADPLALPPHDQAWAKEVGLHQAVCDYVAGMTDRYAQEEYLKLFEPNERT